MRSSTMLAAFAAVAASASASRSYYPAEPKVAPHHMAFVSGVTPTKSNDAVSSTSPQLSCTSPNPWPFRCGLSGNLLTPENTTATAVFDVLDECRDACVNAGAGCSSFGFDADSGNCTVMPHSLKANGLVVAADVTTRYWSRYCFSCVVVGNDTNFLINGDFSTGDLADWTVGAPSVLPDAAYDATYGVTSPAEDNSSYYFYTNLPLGDNLVFLSQLLDTMSNTTYNVTFDFMVDNSGVDQTIYVLAGDDDATGGYEFYVAPGAFVPGEWQTASGSYTSKQNSTMGLIFSASDNQTFYVDNIVVQQVM